jgi:hypothetical protein
MPAPEIVSVVVICMTTFVNPPLLRRVFAWQLERPVIINTVPVVAD